MHDGDGAIAGVNSVYSADVELISGRPFWIYRSALPGVARETADAMFEAAYEALKGEFVSEDGGPIGICEPVGDPDLLRERPEAIWSPTDPRRRYAGYLPDGRQARLSYFPFARINGPAPPAEAFRPEVLDGIPFELARFDEQDVVDEEQVIDMWLDTEVLGAQEAHRRRNELHLVAWHKETRDLAGVTTAWIARNEQLGLDCWYYRAMVAPAHRHSAVAIALGLAAAPDLSKRYVSGVDRRAHGLVFEIENPMIRELYDFAEWQPGDYCFIGVDDGGNYILVHYFPGAEAPPPTS